MFVAGVRVRGMVLKKLIQIGSYDRSLPNDN